MSRTPGVSGATEVYGLLGHPVAQSLSPAMHNAAFRELGLDAVYVPFPVTPGQLEKAVAGLAAVNVRGFNLTVPHKSAILPLLADVAPEARAVGAVNTVRNDAGRLVATNTDGTGFLLSLRHDLGFDPAGKEVLVLGAGGAGRGIAFALLEAGAERLLIANRTAERAVALAADCRSLFPRREARELAWESLAGQAPHLLVNATTVGMGDGASPVELSVLAVRGAVIDIVYHPATTPLLDQARALNLPAANGLGMLLHQGVAAFRFWTGLEPPVEVMRAALTEALPP